MKSLLGKPLVDYLPSVGFAASAIAFLITASTYPQDARAFPSASAFVLLGLSALDLVGLTETRAGRAIRGLLNPAIKTQEAPEPGSRQADTLLSLMGLVAALLLLGIEFGVPLFLLASLRFRARRSWISSILITAGVSIAIWLLFVAALRLDLYRGYLVARFLKSG